MCPSKPPLLRKRPITASCLPTALLLLLSSNMVSALAAPQDKPSEKAKYSTQLVSERITTIIQAAVRRARIKTPNGLQVTTRPLMSTQDYEEVAKFGDEAVPVLLQYQDSKDNLEQEDAIRLLGQVKTDRSVEALTAFALKSESPFARSTALGVLASEFPTAKSAPVLKAAMKSDPDPRVRTVATTLLKGAGSAK